MGKRAVRRCRVAQPGRGLVVLVRAGLRRSGLDHALPTERAERIRPGGNVVAMRDGEFEPFQRERAAVHDDAVEVGHVVARVGVRLRGARLLAAAGRLRRAGGVGSQRVVGSVDVRVAVDEQDRLAERGGVLGEAVDERVVRRQMGGRRCARVVGASIPLDDALSPTVVACAGFVSGRGEDHAGRRRPRPSRGDDLAGQRTRRLQLGWPGCGAVAAQPGQRRRQHLHDPVAELRRRIPGGHIGPVRRPRRPGSPDIPPCRQWRAEPCARRGARSMTGNDTSRIIRCGS